MMKKSNNFGKKSKHGRIFETAILQKNSWRIATKIVKPMKKPMTQNNKLYIIVSSMKICLKIDKFVKA